MPDWFMKETDKECDAKSVFGSRGYLEATKVYCKDDPDCGYVYDPKCDGKPYKLCRKNALIRTSIQGSCIYSKG